MKKLSGNTNVRVWAEEFVKTVKKKPKIAKDEETMITWFANAIMVGYDYGFDKGQENAQLKAIEEGELQ